MTDFGSSKLAAVAGAVALVAGLAAPAYAQEAPTQTLITNVNVFDGVNEALIENANVLVEGNLIKQVSIDSISADGATVIDGGGRTMIPGLIERALARYVFRANIPGTLKF